MQVLLVNSSLSQGGSEKAMTVLANGLSMEGNEVTMLLLRDKPRTYELSPAVNCVQFTYSSKNKLVIFIERIVQLRRALREYKGTYVVSFMDDINKITLLSGIGMKKRIIVSERAYPLAGRSRLDRITENLLYRLADKVVFQTGQVKRYYSNGIARKSHVIANPVSADLPKRFDGERRKEIVAVGRLSKQKNYPMLLKAFSRLKNTEYILRIFGDGSEKERLLKLAEELHIRDRVSFEGFVSGVNEKMNLASIFVSSSDYEGISNAMLEAMGMGLACVCTDCPVGGASMAIQNGVNGLLVGVEQEQELTDALNLLIEDAQLRSRLGREAEKVKERFSEKAITADWLKLFD